MTCPERSAVHRGEISQEHVAECAECRAALARLETARNVLQADLPKFDGPVRARVVRAIEARGQREAMLQRWLWAATGAVVLVGLILLWVRPPQFADDAPMVAQPKPPAMLEPQARALEAGARIEAGRAAIAAVNASSLVVLSRESIRLNAGAIWVDVAATESSEFRVETPFARIELVDARLLVEVTREWTQVSVERGQVRVDPAGITLSAGQRWSSQIIEPIPPALATVPKPKPRASRVVEAIQETPPVAPPPAPPAAVRWLAEADRLRLAGRHAEASDLYRTIALDPASAPYAEEALFLRAQSLAAMNDPRTARSVLDEASTRFPHGALLPERTALASQLALDAGDPIRAAELLEAVEDVTSPVVLEARVHAAQGIAARDRARALELLDARDFERAPKALAALADAARAEIERNK